MHFLWIKADMFTLCKRSKPRNNWPVIIQVRNWIPNERIKLLTKKWSTRPADVRGYETIKQGYHLIFHAVAERSKREDRNRNWQIWRPYKVDQLCQILCWSVEWFQFNRGRKSHIPLESRVKFALHAVQPVISFKILSSSIIALQQ